MARKKSGQPEDVPPPGKSDAAGMLATFAKGALKHPASRAHEVCLELSRSERAILIDRPGLDGELKVRLDIPSTGVKTFPFMMDELARICLALSEALLDAEGRHVVTLLKVTGKVADLLDQAIAEVERGDEPRRPAPKGARNTARTDATKLKATGTVYQLKVKLKHIRPPIWRRLLVPDCSLAKLHEIIQIAMGWESHHLYDFEVGGSHYSDSSDMFDSDRKDARRAKLGRFAPEGKVKIHYTYDFGDNWQHDVLVEKVVPPEEGMTYPVCIGGKRACPPEDVGGPWGYMEFAEAIRDPEHERHEEYLEWEDEFDPEAFSIEEVNVELRRHQ
ncbi:plasmid pRiA4b ORF-3 family protein [Singulisphaera rosea]